MKLVLSTLVLLSLVACTTEENTIEPVPSEENTEVEEFTREELVQAQLLKLNDRVIQEPLDKPLEASFFEEDFMLVHVFSKNKEIEEIPLLFGVTEGEVEITRIALKEGRSSLEIDGTMVSGSSDFVVTTETLNGINQSFADDVLTLTIEMKNVDEYSFEFTQTADGILTDEDGNEFRALSGSLD